MRGRALVWCAIAAGVLTSCEDSTDTTPKYVAGLSPMKEVPANTTSGATGEFTATVSGNTLTYSFNFSGLSSNATLAHIHGPGTTAQAVGVLVNFDAAASGRTITLGATSGTASGTIDISPTAVITATVNGDSLRKLLDNSLLYVNVHSVNFGAGEIRGQIAKN